MLTVEARVAIKMQTVFTPSGRRCGLMVSALVPGFLAGNILLRSWARHFTLTVPLSVQVYKWVPANLSLGGNPAMD